MLNYAENVKIISSFQKKSKPYGKIQSRATHGFIFRIKGSAKYIFEDRDLKLNEGEMIFLPRGSAYEYTTDTRGENLYTSINFEADFESTKITVYPLDNFHGTNYIFRSFSELWKFGTLSDKYKCLSIFYDLLSYASRIEHLTKANSDKYSLIEPAIEYLKSHVYDSAFKVTRLHRLCGISDTYFRKIFTERFNMGPQEYVLSERISHAKSIIESGDYESIREVSELVGYNDPLYFSKAFRKFYGVAPSDMNK
jgi:AraC-like DNA-binding protein